MREKSSCLLLDRRPALLPATQLIAWYLRKKQQRPVEISLRNYRTIMFLRLNGSSLDTERLESSSSVSYVCKIWPMRLWAVQSNVPRQHAALRENPLAGRNWSSSEHQSVTCDLKLSLKLSLKLWGSSWSLFPALFCLVRLVIKAPSMNSDVLNASLLSLLFVSVKKKNMFEWHSGNSWQKPSEAFSILVR